MSLLHTVTPAYVEYGAAMEAGTAYALDDIVVTFSGSISCSVIKLGTTCQGRLITGTNAQGKEFVDEHWLELNIGAGWVPVGGGPAGDTVTLTGTTTAQARINIPDGASTTGDFVANLELFYVE